MIGREVIAALLSGIAVAALAGQIVRPTKRLAGRVRPFAVPARTALGARPDVLDVGAPLAEGRGGSVRQLLWVPVERLARVLGRLIDRRTGEDQQLLNLRRAGLFPGLAPERRLQEYRVRQLGAAVSGAVVAMVLTAVLGRTPVVVLLAGVLGVIVGGMRWRARIDKAVEQRRERMRIELYTVNQVLAMHLRAGGGVMQALRQTAHRGRGVVVQELEEALRAVEGGLPASEALERQASATAEPAAARTFRVLASGIEHGADLATALLELSEDIRDARREAMRRAGTRRQAAMLVPIVCVLAPVMLLFVGAPLPSLIFGNL